MFGFHRSTSTRSLSPRRWHRTIPSQQKPDIWMSRACPNYTSTRRERRQARDRNEFRLGLGSGSKLRCRRLSLGIRSYRPVHTLRSLFTTYLNSGLDTYLVPAVRDCAFDLIPCSYAITDVDAVDILVFTVAIHAVRPPALGIAIALL